MNLITLPPDDPNAVFVFGSNEAGYHGGGAARAARVEYGAEMGTAFGHTGRAFAIPTMTEDLQPLALIAIAGYVNRFLAIAQRRPQYTYYLTPIGCGIAGFTPAQIAPLFAAAPVNVILPEEFRAVASR